MSATKKQLMIDRTHEYLALAAAAPQDYPVDVKAIALFVPCARGLFYKKDEETISLMAEIDAAKEAAPPTPAFQLSGEGLDQLSDPDLESDMEALLQQAGWAMQRFLGFRKRSPGVAEAALAAHDLEATLYTLRRVQQDLAPLLTEYQRRQQCQVQSATPERPESDLFGIEQ